MNQLVSLLSNLSLGMLHALEPGHGKSFFAAYMVGNKLRWKQVSMVIFGMLSAHFLFLITLATIVNFLITSYEGFNLHSVTLAGPFIIIIFGLFLLVNELRHQKHKEHTHQHNDCSCETKYEKHKRKHPVIAGVLIGLLPCPSILTPIMMGIGSSFFTLIFYIFIYVLGMGIVLGAFIVAFNYYSEEINAYLDKYSSTFKPEIVSAVLIIGIGLLYLLF